MHMLIWVVAGRKGYVFVVVLILQLAQILHVESIVVPTKSDSDVVFCLQLLSKTLTCSLHLSLRESIDHMCINPIMWIGLIHKWTMDFKSLITL